MPRQTYAAETLAQQVTELRKSAKVEIADDPDGIDVHRAVKFDKATSKWLEPRLDAINDPRIASLDVSKEVLTVTFVPDMSADTRDPFPLDEADALLSED